MKWFEYFIHREGDTSGTWDRRNPDWFKFGDMTNEKLNKYGEEGWELTAIIGNKGDDKYFYFKRETGGPEYDTD
jgi:hypothetical protein